MTARQRAELRLNAMYEVPVRCGTVIVTCALRHGGLRQLTRAFAGIRSTRSPGKSASGVVSAATVC
jgi:hypothetical protein